MMLTDDDLMEIIEKFNRMFKVSSWTKSVDTLRVYGPMDLQLSSYEIDDISRIAKRYNLTIRVNGDDYIFNDVDPYGW
jgi:hypothetical protein